MIFTPGKSLSESADIHPTIHHTICDAVRKAGSLGITDLARELRRHVLGITNPEILRYAADLSHRGFIVAAMELSDTGSFIVWSDPRTNAGATRSPRVMYPDRASAEREAERMTTTTGHTFLVMRAVSGFRPVTTAEPMRL